MEVLQTSALPLGYVAALTITNSSTIFVNLHYLGEFFLKIDVFHRLDRRKACPWVAIRDLISLLRQNSPSAQSKMDQQQTPRYAHRCQDFALCRG